MMEMSFPYREDLKMLVRFSSLINSSLDIKEVLNNALICVEQLLACKDISFFEVDKAKGELFFRLATGEVAELIKDRRLKIGEGLAGWVALTEKPAIVADSYQDPRFSRCFDSLSGFKTKSILCVPVKTKDQLIGVMEVINKRDGQEFNEIDLELLTLLGNLIGTAVENAYLYGRLQEKLSLTEEELKVVQKKLLQTERLAALGKLSQGVAHEVRNPVTIIGGFVRRLQKRSAPADPCQETCQIILTQLAKLEKMVREIEAFASLSHLKLQPSNLVEVVDQVVCDNLPALSQQAIQVRWESPGDFPLFPIDVNLLRHALQHLVDNAREAMPGGGCLAVTLALEPKGVRITLADTGVGIAPEDLPHLFDPFFSSKPQGTGMGLTTVYRIISDHQGEIKIQSLPGQGTEVQLWLPRWQGE
jgi:two-component system sensor histidine kinase HydH